LIYGLAKLFKLNTLKDPASDQVAGRFWARETAGSRWLAQVYKPEDLVNNTYMFICNLEPKTMMGVESQCMIFAAEDTKGNIVLLRPERDIELGSKIR